MTGWEKIKEKFGELEAVKILSEDNGQMGLIDGEPVRCGSADCDACDFNHLPGENGCDVQFLEYLSAEADGTDWSKVKVDTKVYVRNSKDDNWLPRHFLGYECGKVFVYREGRTSFTEVGSDSYKYCGLANED